MPAPRPSTFLPRALLFAASSTLFLSILTTSFAHHHALKVVQALRVLSLRGSRALEDLYLPFHTLLFSSNPRPLAIAPDYDLLQQRLDSALTLGPIALPAPLSPAPILLAAAVAASTAAILLGRRAGARLAALRHTQPLATPPPARTDFAAASFATILAALTTDLSALTYQPERFLAATLFPLAALPLSHFVSAAAFTATRALAPPASGACPVCDYAVDQPFCPECGWGRIPAPASRARTRLLALSLLPALVLAAAIAFAFVRSSPVLRLAPTRADALLLAFDDYYALLDTPRGSVLFVTPRTDADSPRSARVYAKARQDPHWTDLGDPASPTWPISQSRRLHTPAGPITITRPNLNLGSLVSVRVSPRVTRFQSGRAADAPPISIAPTDPPPSPPGTPASDGGS